MLFFGQTNLNCTLLIPVILSFALTTISRALEINMTTPDGITLVEGPNTIVEVSPFDVITFTTTLEPEMEESVDSVGYTLNFSNSDLAIGGLVLQHWVNNSATFPLEIDTKIDTTVGDNTVSAGTFGTTIPPAVDTGTFQVVAPMNPGDYLLTVNRVSTPITFDDSQVIDLLGNPVALTDYGDVTVRVTGSLVSESIWNVDAIGDWFVDANWNGTSPISADASAVFGSAITTSRTVTVDLPLTVRHVTFDNTNSYNVAGVGHLDLLADASSETAVSGITVLQGTHEFQLRVNLLQDAIVDVASGSSLIFNNSLNLMGETLTKTGDGTIAIQNNLIFGGGMLQIQQGTVSGNGSIGGDVDNQNGTIAPGPSSDPVTVQAEHTSYAWQTERVRIISDTDHVTLLDLPGLNSNYAELNNNDLLTLRPDAVWDNSVVETVGSLATVPEPASLRLFLWVLFGVFSILWRQ